jgi:uncharacterized protein with HEPN domain
MRDDKARLTDILEAIERIENYSIRGEEVFRSNELIQSWMVRHIQVIGEAARSISEDLRNRSPEIPWSDIIGMRHIIVHHYFETDLDIVWRVVATDIPILKAMIMQLVDKLETLTGCD